jgi:sugar/nucleoside kinase (ribokinase family)
MSTPLDFLAIGDITIDAFIKLAPRSAHIVEGARGKEEICMSFGDKIPYEEVEVIYAVGNSPNASVAAARLGLRSAVATNLGWDENGDRCIDSLEKRGVETTLIHRHRSIPTNYHYVLRYEEERTILIKHEVYPYALPAELPEPRWVYLSSLGENSLPHHCEIARWLAEHRDVKLALQPGTFQIKLGAEKLRDLYERATLFFCNKQEAQRITGSTESDMDTLLKTLRGLGPETVIITDGPRGAWASDGARTLHIPMYPDPAPPVDRTGAGDSFASTVTSALALGLDLPEALRWGPVNSMSVVQKVGAQAGLLTRAQIERYLAEAPESYRVREEKI